jgi:hypothetical protein
MVSIFSTLLRKKKRQPNPKVVKIDEAVPVILPAAVGSVRTSEPQKLITIDTHG